MRSDIDITNFTAGELSPRMKGRIDHKNYFNGCETCLNMVVMPQGGATERPGTILAAKAKNQSSKSRMVPFTFSTLQAYALEFSDLNARVYMNRAPVLNGITPVDIVLPYRTADLDALKFAQSADTLFITHPSYPPATLTRTSHIAWTYAVQVFGDGPYLDANITPTTVTPSAQTGSITLLFSSTAGVNNGLGLSASDVGRPVRIKLFSLWAWCVITAVADAMHATATVQSAVNDGASGVIDGAAWAANTDYVTGAVVLGSGGEYYIASVSGRSGTANGPQGVGSKILDGTVIWAALSARDASGWLQGTIYDVNDIILNTGSGNYYQAMNGGKSSGSGSGPSGTGTVADAGITWSYLPPFVFPTATKNWALGAWYTGNGYPYAVRFWQERLFFGGFTAFPNRIIGSQTGDFTNMAPTKSDGSVITSNALDWTIDDDQVNAIHWLVGAGSAQAMQLGIGTLAAEHILQAASTSQALSSTSVQAYSETAYGSAANVNPLRIGKAVLFADRPALKLREWAFYWQSNGYIGPDLLQFSEHITRAPAGSDAMLSGIADLAYQQSPHQVIWARRNDGTPIGFTYDKDQEVFAPHRHQLGGSYYGGAPIVESHCVIPSTDGSYDEVWFAVLRIIGGIPTRTIEVMTQYFDGQAADAAFFVDCGLSSALTFPAAGLTIAGLSNAAIATLPAQFTGTAHLSADADVFSAGSVGNIVRVAGGKLQITAQSDARHVTATVLVALNNQAPAPQGAWSATPLQTHFSGLDHLNGESVQVWGDGADLGTFVVSAGAIDLPAGEGASWVTAGLPFVPVLVTMPWEPLRAAAASTQGKVKRIDHLYVRLYQTRGAKFGRRITDPSTGEIEDKLEPWEERQVSDLMDNAPPLFTGIRKVLPEGGYDAEGQLVFTRDGAGPLTLISCFARGDVEEMPSP